MALILNPGFPSRRTSAVNGVSFRRTGRAAKRRRQLARKRERELDPLQRQVAFFAFTPAGDVVDRNAEAIALFGAPRASSLRELLGADAARELLARVEKHPPCRTPIELPATFADGSRRWLKLIVSSARSGHLVSYAALAEDATPRRRTERLADLLADAANILATAGSSRAAADRITRAAVERLEVDFAGVWWLDPRTQTLAYAGGNVARDAFAPFDEACRTLRYAAGIGLPGRAWSTGAAASVSDVFDDPKLPRGLIARQTGIRAGVAVPVRRGGRTIGALELDVAQPYVPDADFERRFAGLGDQIGLFVDPERP